ncbi:MAG: alkaline phosphatase PhoX [Myxococcota bacterium]
MTKFDTRGFNRRRFLAGASKSAVAIGLAPLFKACGDNAGEGLDQAGQFSYGPIAPVNDETTGLPLLRLPEGFTYRSFGWTGDMMSDGTLTPDRHDGMAVVSGDGGAGECVLMRNHERAVVAPGTPLPLIGEGNAPVYDALELPGVLAGLGGGTTALRVQGGQLLEDSATLAGTIGNCAGGPTPWGSWLTCEETMTLGSLIGAEDHGFVFEVPDPALGPASAVPITDMGLMSHEAVAVDPRDSRVYVTEDNGPLSGFYRFTPNDSSQRIGSLEAGGTLEMLGVVDQPGFDLATAEQGEVFEVVWVAVPDPTAGPETLASPGPGFPDIVGVGRSGPFLQGEANGGASMRRGEGCWYQDGVVYVVDTSGGAAGKGTVWAYVPEEGTLTALFVSPGAATADNPDNVTVTPAGAIIVCEDGGGIQEDEVLVTGTRMIGIGQDGGSFIFAENNMVLDAALPDRPFIEPGDYRGSEWAGACFDPAGVYLYVNIQTPGVTFAITGPWERGGF